MNIEWILNNFKALDHYKNWVVLEDDFTWELEKLHNDVFSTIKNEYNIPVVFCCTSQSNVLVSTWGEEETEFLYVPSAVYWREVDAIFVYRYDDYEDLLSTLFHEFRHVQQDLDESFRKYFETDRKLPYEQRVTEKDAFYWAEQWLNTYKKSNLSI